MATSLANDLNVASKRSRSQHSPAPLDPSPPSKATRTGTPEQNAKIPAFLRQSKADIILKFRELNWQEKIRIAQGRSDPESKWFQDMSPLILQRNRYMGVQPWNRSRVHLKVAEGTSDYINASPISLRDPRTNVENAYIATQGPKKNGISPFWQMVRHETKDVAVIVMLTPTEESGREKCFQYFPLNGDVPPFKISAGGFAGDSSEGDLSFVEIEANSGPNTQVRKLQLKFGEETKVVWHLLYTAFPDFGVPEDEDRAELLDLLHLSETKNSGPTNPRIIHCSAGVGRSGTFIALDYLLSQLDSGAVREVTDDQDLVKDVVHRLREQRMMMVQMDNQFEFLYDILREQFVKKMETNVPSGQPSPKMRKLASGMKASTIGESVDGIIDIGDSPAEETKESGSLLGESGKSGENQKEEG